MGNREAALENLKLAHAVTRKGSISKWRQIQNSIAEVYERLGGSDGLFDWVEESPSNKRDFYNHICRSLGSKVDITLQGSQVLIMVDDMQGEIGGSELNIAVPSGTDSQAKLEDAKPIKTKAPASGKGAKSKPVK